MKEINIQQIEILRSQGLTYTEIAKGLGCTRYTIYNRINPQYLESNRKRINTNALKAKEVHPFYLKTRAFTSRKFYSKKNRKPTSTSIKRLKLKVRQFTMNENTFTYKDVIDKFGEHPTCYLTGEPIDIYDTKSYHFDHIIPTSKGGSNTLDNLGICTAQANKVKGDLTPQQLFNFCRQILDYQNRTGKS